ncbi:MAG TPA: ABC transporter permease [Thermomicrobiales bacterium]|nr:ABC transporter permease [Thermomicrobiales bacterium]
MTAPTASTPGVISTTESSFGVTTQSARSNSANAVPGFQATQQSEWTKLRSVRSTWIIVSLAIGLSIAFSAVIALVTGLTFDSWGSDGQAAFDPVLTPMSGWLFGIVLLTVLSVTSVTSEYSSRMIRTTFIVKPRRMQVFAAKASVVAMFGLAISVITTLGMFLISQPIYRYYGLATAGITDSAAIRLLIVTVLGQGLIYTLVPFSFAWLLRGTASAITVSIGFLFLPWTLGAIVPAWVQHNLLRYLPDMAANSLSGLTKTDATTYLSQTPAIIVIAIWLAAMPLLAAVILNRRDV